MTFTGNTVKLWKRKSETICTVTPQSNNSFINYLLWLQKMKLSSIFKSAATEHSAINGFSVFNMYGHSFITNPQPHASLVKVFGIIKCSPWNEHKSKIQKKVEKLKKNFNHEDLLSCKNTLLKPP